MEALTHSPKDFYETIQQVLRIKHFLYQETRHQIGADYGRLYGGGTMEEFRARMRAEERHPEHGIFTDHFPERICGKFIKGENQQIWETPRGLFITTDFLLDEYVLSFYIKASDGKKIILQTIKMKEGESYEPVFSPVGPYIDPLFEQLKQRVTRTSIRMNLDDERTKEEFLKQLLR